MALEILEVCSCNFADYTTRLPELVIDWQQQTGRTDINNRKDWEFITMAYYHQKYAINAKRVLDTACGRESLVNWLASRCETVIATDYWEPNYLKAAEITLEDFLTFWRHLPNVYPMLMDTMRLQFHDNVFDATYCVSSIEHFGPEDGQHEGGLRAVREMERVTRVGGLVSFSTEVVNNEQVTDKWFFSKGGLQRFINKLANQVLPPFQYDMIDGAAEGLPLHPVVVIARKTA